jgi:hypothetical protein
MRMHRILTAVIAFALFGLTPLAVASTASARVASDVDRSSQADAGKRLPHRNLHDKVVSPSRHKLVFKGRVDPGHGPVIIEKKNCRKGCPWHKVDKARTDSNSRWSIRIFAPHHGEWFYRGYVQAYGGYAKSKTGIWRTYTI